MVEKVNLPCRSRTFKISKGDSKAVGISTTCHKDCSVCGFNPAVSKARLAKGHFIEDTTVNITEFNDDGSTNSYYIGGLKQLVFPKGISVGETG